MQGEPLNAKVPWTMWQSVPEELKAHRRWVCYNKKKEPINAMTGGRASSTNNKTWSTYDEAVDAMQKRNLTGIGFVLGDGYAGIDIDGCVINGVISPEAQQILAPGQLYRVFPQR